MTELEQSLAELNVMLESDPEAADMMGAMLSVMLAVAGVLIVLWLIWCVLRIVANWKIFAKAGEAGWKSLVPIYNRYVQFQLVWKLPVFWVYIALFFGSGIFASISQNLAETNAGAADVLAILGSILVIAWFVLDIMFQNKLAKAFGKGTGFTVGLVLLNPVFMLILGLGKAKYLGNTTTEMIGDIRF